MTKQRMGLGVLVVLCSNAYVLSVMIDEKIVVVLGMSTKRRRHAVCMTTALLVCGSIGEA